MFDGSIQSLAVAEGQIARPSGSTEAYRILAWREGRRIWERSRTCGRLRYLWGWLTGRSQGLCDLRELSSAVGDQHYLGLRTVPLASIIGSEGRCRDFDAGFNPRQSATLERWLGVYSAIYQGIGLPPVSLIEIRGKHFVRDGHHRISVARTLGKVDVDAEVTAWDVSGPLPWEKQALTPALRRERSGVEIPAYAAAAACLGGALSLPR
jgi:hypothetical protein